MPYLLSHLAFAYNLGTRFHCFSDKQSLSLFSLGALGPDVFFYDRLPPTPFVPNQKKVGNALHHIPCDALIHSLLEHVSDQSAPFIYGFITHIALDSTLHPYVCARSSGLDHTRFEGDIDAVIYSRFREQIPFETLLSLPPSIRYLDEVIKSVCKDLNLEVKPGAYERSVKKLLNLFPILYDPEGRKYKAVMAIEHAIGCDHKLSSFLLAAPRSAFADCMNENRNLWFAVTFPDVPRKENVDELFISASKLSESMFSAFRIKDYSQVCELCSNRTMGDGPHPLLNSP